MSDLVSVIMPAYNCEQTVLASIESVQHQTYQNWELIIVDDCSTDNTSKVCERIALVNEKIKVFSLGQNGGVASARNKAISLSKGRFLAFLDSDDLWDRNKLSTQISLLQKSGGVFCITGYRRISHDGKSVGNAVTLNPQISVHKLLQSNFIITSSVLIDREQYPDVILKNVYYDDIVLWFEMLASGCRCVVAQEPLLSYRLTKGSLSRNKLKSAREVWKIYRNQFQLPIFSCLYYFSHYAVNGVIKTWLK